MNPFADTPLHGTPLAPVAQQMVDDGWPIQHDPEQPALFTAFAGQNGERRAILVFEPGVGRILIYTMMYDDSPPAIHSAMVELITRINYGLGAGCFEMDLNDGEVRYRVTWPAEMTMPHVVIPALIDACMTVDTYAPTFNAVSKGKPILEALEDLKAATK
jgi:hypothetical protein